MFRDEPFDKESDVFTEVHVHVVEHVVSRATVFDKLDKGLTLVLLTVFEPEVIFDELVQDTV